MSSNLYAVFESRVRAFDPATKIATIIIPGSYGMEPFDAPPFTRSGMDPSVIEDLVVGDRVLVVQGENEVPEWLSTNPDWYRSGEAHFVKKTGDTMTGPLHYYDQTYGPVGWIGTDPATYSMKLASELATDIMLQAGPGALLYLNGGNTVGPSIDFNSMDFPGTHVLNFGAVTRQMINLWSTSFGIGVQSSTTYLRGTDFSFHSGGVHSDTRNDPGAGGIELMRIVAPATPTVSIPGRLGSNFLLGDSVSSGPRLRMHLPASGELAYIDFEGTTAGAGVLNLRSGASTVISVNPTFVDISTSGVYRGRLAANWLIGKTASDTATVGIVLNAVGRIYATTTSANALNLVTNIVTAVDNDPHIDFRRNDTSVGAIRMNGTTTVSYDTSSDARFKHVLGEIEDDEAIVKILAYRPVKYQWKLDENKAASVDGEPTGRVEWGLLAQEAIEVDTVPANRGIGEPGEEGFRPWGMDYGRLTPDILAAVRALIHRFEALTLEVAELRGSAPSN